MSTPAPAVPPVVADAVLASLAAPSGLTTSVGEPSPSPTTPAGDLEDYEVSPGLLGFLPVFLIALACVGLFLSLTRQLRKVNVRQAQLDAESAAQSDDGAEPDDGPAPDGPAPDGRQDRPGPR